MITKAYRRDQSFAGRTVERSTVWHMMQAQYGVAYCGVLLDTSTGENAAKIPNKRRCRRAGCLKRWLEVA